MIINIINIIDEIIIVVHHIGAIWGIKKYLQVI